MTMLSSTFHKRLAYCPPSVNYIGQQVTRSKKRLGYASKKLWLERLDEMLPYAPHSALLSLIFDLGYLGNTTQTLLPSVNTIARGMFCGAKYTHHTFTPIIKHH